MRISGLASGMDIDSIVSDMMKAKRIPLDKLKQKKQTLEWQRDEYRTMNRALLDFRLELTQYKLTTKYRAREATSSDETKLTATATSAAAKASYTIKNVTSLASAATRVSGEIAGAGQKIDATKSLYSQQEKFGDKTFKWSTGVVESYSKKVSEDTSTFKLELAEGISLKSDSIANMSIKVDGKSLEVVTGVAKEDLGANQVLVDGSGNITFGSTVSKDSTVKIDYVADKKIETTTTTDAIKEMQLAKGSIADEGIVLKIGDNTYRVEKGSNEIKSDADEVIGTINKETGKITFATEQPKDTKISVEYKQNYASFSIATYNENGKKDVNFLITGNQSLNSVISQVNDSDAGVSMMYDSFTSQISMTRTETGDFNKDGDEIVTSGAFLQDLLKFEGKKETGGTNVKFTINGLTTERYSNQFEMNGVTFTIKDMIDNTGVTTTITNNTNAVFDNIKSFVDKYNELIGSINAKISEEYYRDYNPLTDDERESLTEKQQEEWEKKAKSGLLRRDQTLTSLLSSMRIDFASPVSNSDVNSLYSQLASIGITTTSNYLEGGKLEIDEAKLKKAIEEDPTSVENLFRGGSDATSSSQKGIIHRLYETVDNTYKLLKTKAGDLNSGNTTFTLGRSLDSMNDQISRFETRLKTYENRIWKQFTAMETAIQKANSQSTYLSNMFSTGY